MHQDKQDQDFEVCLTSEEYTRILSNHTQKETLKTEKINLEREVETLTKKIASLEKVSKEKDKEIDEVSVQCLKLKKVRLIQEDEILNLKQELAGSKEKCLGELEQSVLENKDMKECKLRSQAVICELRQELATMRDCLKQVSERSHASTLQLQRQFKAARETIAKQSQETTELRRKIDQLQKETARAQSKLVDKDKAYNVLSVEHQKKSAMLDQLQAKYKKDIHNCEDTRRSLEQQMALLKTEGEALLNEEDAHMAKLAGDKVKLTVLLREANEKIQFLDKDSGSNNGVDEGKFGSKLTQALRLVKKGDLSTQDLSSQIQGMFGLEKEYENIIALRGQNIDTLTAEVKSLQQRNSQLKARNSLIDKEFRASTSLVQTLSNIKVKSEEHSKESEIFVLREEVQKLSMKLRKVHAQLDQSVKSYNHTISDTQLSHQKQLASLIEVQSEMQALRLDRKFQGQAIHEAIDNIYQQMANANNKGQTLTPESVLALLKTGINKLFE